MRSMKIVMVDWRDIKGKKTVGYINMYSVAECLCRFVEKLSKRESRYARMEAA